MPHSNQNKNTLPQVQYLEIDLAHEGQRIDNFLVTHLKGVPKTHIYRLLRKGEIRVNKGRIKPTYRIIVGDSVRLPPLRLPQAKSSPNCQNKQLDFIKNAVLYEDKDLIVLNKPSGIAVHGGSGISFGVIEMMRVLYPKERRVELVHRLDRDTSGCLIIAKKTSTLRALHQYLREDQLEKRYLTLVKGHWQDKHREVKFPLKKGMNRSGERYVYVHAEGKPSRTDFHVQQKFAQMTLLEARLLTGRTHQIRVHTAHASMPIAGDEKYGDKHFNQTMQSYGLHRLFLHARFIKFVHPATKEMVTVTAPLDAMLQNVLNNLSKPNV